MQRAILTIIMLLLTAAELFGQSGTKRDAAGEARAKASVPSTSMLALPFKRAWQFLTDSSSSLPPVLDDSRVFLPLSGGRILCLSRETGDLLWSSDLGGIISAPLAANEKSLLVATSKAGEDGAEAGASIRALDKSTGLTLWASDYARPFTSPPTVAGDRIYAGSADGALYALSARDGKVIWKAQTQDVVRGQPAVMDRRIYFGSDDGAMRGVETANGQEVWKFQTGAKVTGRPAFDGRTIYFGSGDGFVYAVDITTHKLRWRSRAGASVGASVVLAGDRIIAASFDNFVYALARSNGNRVWKRRLENRIASTPIVEGDATLIAPLHGDYVAVFLNSDGRPMNFFRLEKGLEIVAEPVLVGRMLAIATDRGLVVAIAAESVETPVNGSSK